MRKSVLVWLFGSIKTTGKSLDDIKNLTVALPDGQQIPFEQIADISVKSGPAQVSRENTKRRITIGFNVRNRDIQKRDQRS